MHLLARTIGEVSSRAGIAVLAVVMTVVVFAAVQVAAALQFLLHVV